MCDLTVSIPAFNRIELLEEALASVEKQTFREFEVLVSDNASSEDIGAVLAKFPTLRIRHVRHNSSLGMVGNWQFSLLAPKTKYIAWMHDDDRWEVDHLQRAMEDLEANPDAGFWSCATRHFDGKKTTELQTLFGFEGLDAPRAFSGRETVLLWLYRQNAQCSAAVFRRSTLSQVFWGPAKLCHRLDYLILSQAALSSEWVYNPKATAYFRVGNADKMSKKKSVLGTAVVQSNFVQRYLLEYAFQRRWFDPEEFANSIVDWPIAAKAGLLSACLSYFAPSDIRRLGKLIRRRYPAILHDTGSGRGAQMGGRLGMWIIPIVELYRCARCNWWPIGEQSPRLPVT